VRSTRAKQDSRIHPAIFVWPWPQNIAATGPTLRLAVSLPGTTGSGEHTWLKPGYVGAFFLPPADNPTDTEPVGVIHLASRDHSERSRPLPDVPDDDLRLWIHEMPTWRDVLARFDPDLPGALRPPAAAATTGKATVAEALAHAYDATYGGHIRGDAEQIRAGICQWIRGD
jgi:hypothetical protein